MSDWDEKLQRPVHGNDNIARRPWSSLKDVPSLRILEGPAHAPKLVSIRIMREETWWQRTAADGKSNGLSHIYQAVALPLDRT